MKETVAVKGNAEMAKAAVSKCGGKHGEGRGASANHSPPPTKTKQNKNKQNKKQQQQQQQQQQILDRILLDIREMEP